MSQNHKEQFDESIKRLSFKIKDRELTRTSRMLARLDYFDKVTSNYLQTTENVGLYYLLGIFGWLFNREKSLLMALTVGMNAYYQPEKMFKQLDVVGYDP